MHVRECSSKAITLHCTHARSKSAKCKATARIIILDPKVIKSEKKVQAKRDRTIFKLDYEFPDIKDLSKYGTVTTIKPHTCQSTPSLFGVSREFRHTNGKLSVNLNKDQTQSQFDNSNLTDIMSVDKLARKAGFSLRKEKFSAQKKIQNSKSYTRTDLVPNHCKNFTVIDDSFSASRSELSLPEVDLMFDHTPANCTDLKAFFIVPELRFMDEQFRARYFRHPVSPVHSDGTFFVIRHLEFAQLYTLAVYLPDPKNSNKFLFVPVVFALLTGKSTLIYEKLFRLINSKFREEYGRDLEIKFVMTDFESSARKAFENVFNSTVSNCQFHALQNFKRNILKYCHTDFYKSPYLTELFCFMKGLIFFDPEFVKTALSQFRSVKIPTCQLLPNFLPLKKIIFYSAVF